MNHGSSILAAVGQVVKELRAEFGDQLKGLTKATAEERAGLLEKMSAFEAGMVGKDRAYKELEESIGCFDAEIRELLDDKVGQLHGHIGIETRAALGDAKDYTEDAIKPLLDIEGRVNETLEIRVAELRKGYVRQITESVESLQADIDKVAELIVTTVDTVDTAFDEQENSVGEKLLAARCDIERFIDDQLTSTSNSFKTELATVTKGVAADIQGVQATQATFLTHVDGLHDKVTAYVAEVKAAVTAGFTEKLEHERETRVLEQEALSADLASIITELQDNVESLDATRLSIEDSGAAFDAINSKFVNVNVQLSAINDKAKEAEERWGSFGEDVIDLIDEAKRMTADLSATVHGRLNGLGEAHDMLQAKHTKFTEAQEARNAELIEQVQGSAAEVEQFLASQVVKEADIKNFIEQNLNAWPDIAPYGKGGPDYRELALVSHNKGIWQATKNTNAEPNTCGDWVCLVDGIHDIHIKNISPQLGTISVETRFASGRTAQHKLIWPSPNFLGTWVADTKYEILDSTLDGGNRWIACVDNPQGQPSKSKDWKLYALGGARGRRGKAGVDGVAPTPVEILHAWNKYLEADDAIPLNRFRGTWEYDGTFRKYDVVWYRNGLYISLYDQKGIMPPDAVDAGLYWMPLFIVSSRGGTGGTGTGGGHVILDHGTPMPQREELNFTGTGVVVEDIDGVTTVTVSSSAGGPVDWDDIVNKPAEYPPEPHSHTAFAGAGSTGFVPDPVTTEGKFLSDDGSFTDVPPDGWNDITGKPAQYPPEPHIHAAFAGAGSTGFVPDPVTTEGKFLSDDGSFTDVPPDGWNDITGKPAEYPPEPHSHTAFAGAGSTGFVPDPVTTEGKFLSDDGSFVGVPVSPVGGIELAYRWDSDITAVNPGAGRIAGNNIDHTLITEIYVNSETRNGNDAAFIWESRQTGSYLGIWEESGDTESIYFSINANPVDNGGWFTIGVSVIPGSIGGMENNRAIGVFMIGNPLAQMPAGGTTGQHLVKVSDTDFDTDWEDPSANLLPGTINMIINGNFTVAQRGHGSVGTEGGNGYTGSDRWSAYSYNAAQLDVGTYSDEGASPSTNGICYGYGIAVTTFAKPTTTAFASLSQRIEGFNSARLAWGTPAAKSATLSFRVVSNVAGVFAIAVRNATADRSFVATYTVAQVDVAELITINIPAETNGAWSFDNGVGVYLDFTMASSASLDAPSENEWVAGNFLGSSSATNLGDVQGSQVVISDVQFEVGDEAHNYEILDYSIVITQCQRYYQSNCLILQTGYQTAGSAFYSSNSLRCTMRIPPAITVVAETLSNLNSVNKVANTNDLYVTGYAVAAAMTSINATYNVDAELP